MKTSEKVTLKTEKKQWQFFGLALLFYLITSGLQFLWTPASDRAAVMRLQITLFCVIAVCGTCYLAFPATHQRLKTGINKLRALNQNLDTPQRLYRNVIVLSITLILTAKICPGPWMLGLLAMFAAFCTFVALYDAIRLYQSISTHPLGKAIIGLAFAAVSTLAYALARQEIADVVHVTPSNFIHSTLLVAIMTIPFLAVAAGGIAYIGSTVVLVFILPFLFLVKEHAALKAWLFAGLLKENTMKYPIITRVFQVLFYSVLGVTLLKLGQKQMLPYEIQLKEKLPALVYQFDLYHGSECPLNEGEKLAPLGDAKFLIGKQRADGKIDFLPPVKCDDLPMRAKSSGAQ
jgi:hypothetical protein